MYTVYIVRIENYKTLKKEIKGDTRRWKDLLCPNIVKVNNMKMAIILKAIYRFNAIPIKINAILHRSRKINPKIYMEE
jgi:hypothetical protein